MPYGENYAVNEEEWESGANSDYFVPNGKFARVVHDDSASKAPRIAFHRGEWRLEGPLRGPWVWRKISMWGATLEPDPKGGSVARAVDGSQMFFPYLAIVD